MHIRTAAILGLLALSLSLGGCTKCGWLWDETHACRADAPRTAVPELAAPTF